MSKGWESKNIEEQQAQATASSHAAAAEGKSAQHREDAEKKRKIQALEMQRERVLSERTASAHRRSALQQALAVIEYELEQLGWSIKI